MIAALGVNNQRSRQNSRQNSLLLPNRPTIPTNGHCLHLCAGEDDQGSSLESASDDLHGHHHHGRREISSHQNAMAAAAAEGAKLGVEGAKIGPMSHQMTPPRMDRPKKSPLIAQLFLCTLGIGISLGVGIWFSVFSPDPQIRRAIGSAVAFVAALVFTLLAYATLKKRRQKKVPEIDFSTEISASILREHRRSMSNSFRKQAGVSGQSVSGEELFRQIRRHSTSITIESYERQLQLQKHNTGSCGTAGAVVHAAVTRTLSPPSEHCSASLSVATSPAAVIGTNASTGTTTTTTSATALGMPAAVLEKEREREGKKGATTACHSV